MVLHTVRWQLARELDLAAVRESFERHGLESHDDPPAWVLSRDTPSMPRATILNFSLDVDANVLTGEMNSVERADEARALIDDAFPGAQVLDVDASNARRVAIDRERRRRTVGATRPERSRGARDHGSAHGQHGGVLARSRDPRARWPQPTRSRRGSDRPGRGAPVAGRIPPAVVRDAGRDGPRPDSRRPRPRLSAESFRRLRPPANVSRPVRTSRRTGATWREAIILTVDDDASVSQAITRDLRGALRRALPDRPVDVGRRGVERVGGARPPRPTGRADRVRPPDAGDDRHRAARASRRRSRRAPSSCCSPPTPTPTWRSRRSTTSGSTTT